MMEQGQIVAPAPYEVFNPKPVDEDLVTTLRVLQMLSGPGMNERIEILEKHLMTMPQLDIPIREWIVNGMYAREAMFPAGALITSRPHKNNYLIVVIEGSGLIATEQGLMDFTAPMIMEGLPGRKLVGLVGNDIRWLSIDRTDCTDLEKVLDSTTTRTMAEFFALSTPQEKELKCLQSSQPSQA